MEHGNIQYLALSTQGLTIAHRPWSGWSWYRRIRHSRRPQGSRPYDS